MHMPASHFNKLFCMKAPPLGARVKITEDCNYTWRVTFRSFETKKKPMNN